MSRRSRRAFPSSALALVATAAAALGCATTADAADAEEDASFASLEQALFEAVAARRAEAGLGALRWSDEVAAIAREHSRAMAAGEAPLGHDGFRARAARIGESRTVTAAAENVSKHRGRSETEVRDIALAKWLASDVHRRNLEGAYDTTGVGVARSEDGVFFVTQIFVGAR